MKRERASLLALLLWCCGCSVGVPKARREAIWAARPLSLAVEVVSLAAWDRTQECLACRELACQGRLADSACQVGHGLLDLVDQDQAEVTRGQA